jgi:hypothetical protein
LGWIANSVAVKLRKRTRDQFAKYLVLNFLASNIYLWPWTQVSTLDGWKPLEIFNSYSSGRGRYSTELLAKCEDVLKDLEELKAALEFLAQVLKMSAEDEDVVAETSVQSGAERMMVLQCLCQQRLNNTKRYMSAMIRAHEASSHEENIKESGSIKRLTILATVFLPLSLASSILSMQTRLRDLGILLFDFLGVFVVTGCCAVLLLLLVDTAITHKKNAPSRPMFWAQWKAHSWWAPKDLLEKWKATKPHTHERQYFGESFVAMSILYILVWLVLASSFLTGMLFKVKVGMILLGAGSATILIYLSFIYYIRSLLTRNYLFEE